MLWNLGRPWFLRWNLNETGLRRIVEIFWMWEARYGRVLLLFQKLWLRTFTTDCIQEGSAIGSLSIYMLVHRLHRVIIFRSFLFMVLTKTCKLFLFFSLLSWDELWRIPRTSLRFSLFLNRSSLNKTNWFIRIVCNDFRTRVIMCLFTAFFFVFFIV